MNTNWRILSTLLLFLIHFPACYQPTSIVHAKIKDPTVQLRGQQKKVITVADYMFTESDPALYELREALTNEPGLTQKERILRWNTLVRKYHIEPNQDGSTRKVQMVQTVDGKNKFTITFIGANNVMDNFAGADKSGIRTIRDLAEQLDRIYRDESAARSVILKENLKIKPHEFSVNDGKDIYTIKVGRTKEERGGASQRPKPPKIKKRGNFYMQGWDQEMRRDLEATFKNGRRKYFGLFGKKKRAEISSEMALEKLAAAYKKQSTYLHYPGPVSASFSGGMARSDGQWEQIVRLDEQEVRRVNAKAGKPTQEIVGNYYGSGWMKNYKHMEWRNPQLAEYIRRAEQKYGPNEDESGTTYSDDDDDDSGDGGLRNWLNFIRQKGKSGRRPASEGSRKRHKPDGPSSSIPRRSTWPRGRGGSIRTPAPPEVPSDGVAEESAMKRRSKKNSGKGWSRLGKIFGRKLG